MTATSVFAKMQRGHHDDGREGVLLAKIAAGDLVKVPFGSGTVASSGGLAYTIGSGSASVQSGSLINPDASGTGINFSVPSGLSQSARWSEQIYGSTIGVRWRRNNTSTVLPFSLVVDGVAHTVRNTRYHRDSVYTTAADMEAMRIVATDLDPTVPHTVDLIVHSDPYGAVTKSLFALGWLLERSAGYQNPPNWGAAGAAVTLATSTTALSSSNVYRKLFFHNTGASTRTVTIKLSSTIIKVLSLAAGTSGEWDPGISFTGLSSITVQQDVGTDVVMVPFQEARR